MTGRLFSLAALATLAFSALVSTPAQAGVYVGVGVGVPGPYYRGYYRYPGYYYPRVYVAPPPVVIAPPPVAVVPAPVYVQPRYVPGPVAPAPAPAPVVPAPAPGY
jgi:hypothetical protein